jgi:hypothetical protein
MGVEFATERRLLSEDEIGPVLSSHYPELGGMAPDDLIGLARWLRARRARARDIIYNRRRILRGKGELRGTATENASERGLAAKKQVFGRALKRVNGRIARLKAEEKRIRAVENLNAALLRRRSEAVHHPVSGMSAHQGMRALPSEQRRGIISGTRIGSVSQAGKRAQAARDRRGAPGVAPRR